MILPFGTGNDLSRSLGWGINVANYNVSIDRLVPLLLKASEDKLALWNVSVYSEVQVFKNSKLVLASKNGVFNEFLCNYFNIGIDAEIQYSNHY